MKFKYSAKKIFVKHQSKNFFAQLEPLEAELNYQFKTLEKIGMHI